MAGQVDRYRDLVLDYGFKFPFAKSDREAWWGSWDLDGFFLLGCLVYSLCFRQDKPPGVTELSLQS